MRTGGNRSGGVKRGLKIWPILLFVLYFGYYYVSHRESAPYTGRTQLIDTTPRQEAALGLQSYREILSQSDTVDSGPVVNQVRGVTQRLVDVAPQVEKYLAQSGKAEVSTDWSSFDWQVSVIDSPQVNAFCLPGGKIAVYTGIMPVAANEDGLAAIIGHEIAHALLRHGGERLAQQKLVQLGTLAAGMSMSDMEPQQQRMVMAALGAGGQYGVLLPFSRRHESEADYVGLMLSAAACFNPGEAPLLWQRMAELGQAQQKPAEITSTHPSEATRIQQLQEWMPDAERVRQHFCASP